MFVDQSGRRGRILTVTAIGSGAVVVTLLAFVVTGMLGGTELPGLGWPGKAQQGPTVGGTASRSPDVRPTRTPQVSPSATTVPQVPSPTASRRAPQPTPETTPSAGRPGNTPPPDAQGSVAGNPGHGGTPPGQAEKTHGPK
ncbi:hypothetical protein GCM10023193_40020 [Planotetraspora kaengkrachanensis]|uniref:Uncharacterized protein n=1 Tax=Planotetraspora kaengkrachanensis TaxID=575193 RepID=A0A8J3M0M1_9ACTN|nr:hypothetical protein Pka01_33220 [Planotetraspora kaengkrachanensis]